MMPAIAPNHGLKNTTIRSTTRPAPARCPS